jgi:ABC-2 type transport system ATP-binding protein
MSIQVSQLTKVYGPQTAVNHISFSIAPGEIVGFLGPNGAGKSTTMKMLTGFLSPDEGTATVAGISVAEKPLEAKKKIGYLPESNALYYDMYVREYLDFTGSTYGIKDIKNRVEAVIAEVGLTPEANKKIGQLSKGYKQRVGLAAALLHNPEVLILDEPTSGLDPNQIIEIREVIRKLGQQKTVLFSSHIMQEVKALCSRVIIINKGNLVADDQLSNLEKPSTTNVVKVHFQEPLETQWLQRLQGVKVVHKIDTHNWSLETENPEAVRKAVLQMAIEHNLNIVSLQSESQSLEDIFRQLTNTPKA